MKTQPVVINQKVVGVHAYAETPEEAATMQWMWEHNFQLVGYSVGISGETMIALSCLPYKAKPIKPPPEPKPIIQYHEKDGTQNKLF
jgi:hypothetical protein